MLAHLPSIDLRSIEPVNFEGIILLFFQSILGAKLPVRVHLQ